MKNLILSAAVLLGVTFSANAQNSSPAPVKVKVNVNLNSFQSIEIGSGATPSGEYGDIVNLTYADANDYRNGISKNVPNQLKVSSIGSGYKVKAKLSQAVLNRTSAEGAQNIQANEILEIQVGKNLAGATSGKIVTLSGVEFTDLSASNTGSASVLDEQLDVKYFGKPIPQNKLQTYFNNVGNKSLSYTVDVLYEILPL
ncbi:hypothetical protein [Sphingobacterium litopenaei]|uniref:Uncharacterized protein n=1 Tax=Sphingobacterium litopenaei TaxID=2763500 RepID=A0ABR7YEQ4_9SPHI|nr:hypothetical protein [Sphingobacterium litopenaei]MBD1429751.1 hypothetical protein [Sphingobacterium litopenaei]